MPRLAGGSARLRAATARPACSERAGRRRKAALWGTNWSGTHRSTGESSEHFANGVTVLLAKVPSGSRDACLGQTLRWAGEATALAVVCLRVPRPRTAAWPRCAPAPLSHGQRLCPLEILPPDKNLQKDLCIVSGRTVCVCVCVCAHFYMSTKVCVTTRCRRVPHLLKTVRTLTPQSRSPDKGPQMRRAGKSVPLGTAGTSTLATDACFLPLFTLQ